MKNRDWHKQLRDITHWLRKILTWSSFVVLFLVSGLFVYHVVDIKIMNNDKVNYKPEFALYSILTGSMEPNIRVDDVIFTRKINAPDELKVGDVITFVSENPHTKGTIITHRVESVNQTVDGYSYVTKGDANETKDNAPVSFEGIIGKVIFKIPKLGILRKIVSNKFGWLFLVLIPATFVILVDLIKASRAVKLNKTAETITKQKKTPDIRDVSELKQKLLEKRTKLSALDEMELPRLRN